LTLTLSRGKVTDIVLRKDLFNSTVAHRRQIVPSTPGVRARERRLCVPAETILVVEDNADVAELLTRDFLPNLGYNTMHARTGEDAMVAIQKAPRTFSSWIFNLPGIDGISMLRRLSERDIAIRPS